MAHVTEKTVKDKRVVLADLQQIHIDERIATTAKNHRKSGLKDEIIKEEQQFPQQKQQLQKNQLQRKTANTEKPNLTQMQYERYACAVWLPKNTKCVLKPKKMKCSLQSNNKAVKTTSQIFSETNELKVQQKNIECQKSAELNVALKMSNITVRKCCRNVKEIRKSLTSKVTGAVKIKKQISLAAVAIKNTNNEQNNSNNTNDNGAAFALSNAPSTSETAITLAKSPTTVKVKVKNIDASNKSLFLVSNYVNDVYSHLYELEIKHSIDIDHLKNQTEITPKMRAILLNWINEIHLQSHYTVETFYMTVNIIDRYLQNVADTRKIYFQLVGMAALFIAAKYEELFGPIISDLIYASDNSYTQKQMVQMEMYILKVLDFNLSAPLPIHFLRRFSKAAFALEIHHIMAKYFMELISIEYTFASFKSSQIAAAALFLALNLLQKNVTHNNDDDNDDDDNDDDVVVDIVDVACVNVDFNDALWTPTLVYYSRYKAENLHDLSRKIAAVARNAHKATLKSVFEKYQSKSFKEISMHPILSSSFIDALIEGNEKTKKET